MTMTEQFNIDELLKNADSLLESLTLANASASRFLETTGNDSLEDLETNILIAREEIGKLQPTAEAYNRCLLLNNLSSLLRTRFEQKGTIQDLEERIELEREMLNLQPAPNPAHSGLLFGIAMDLFICYGQKGAIQDLEECILLHKEALDLRPPPHPGRSDSLVHLSKALYTLFEKDGNASDLEECITLRREALASQPAHHSGRAELLSSLAIGLHTRFELKGAAQDLEECILLYREALGLQYSLDPSRSTALNNLAGVLSNRFGQKGDLDDLEECIRLHREALDLRPVPHPDRSYSLSNLGYALLNLFVEKGNTQNLEECVLLQREALDLRPAPHPDRHHSLNNLACALQSCYEQKETQKDLEECIVLQREALALQPAIHSDHLYSLNNLAHALLSKKNGTNEDIDESILLYKEALDIAPSNHPFRSRLLHNLARALETRFERNIGSHSSEITLRNTDAEAALQYFEEASRYEFSPLLDRLRSSKRWIRSAQKHRPASTLDAHRYAMELLPLLASVDLTLRQRRSVLEHGKELVGNAAKCAISSAQFETAVIFLSSGRSIFWSQALQLRTPTDAVAATRPDLAEKFTTISKKLENASYLDPYPGLDLSAPSKPTTSIAEYTSLSYLADQRRQTIEEIRKVPGCGDFLLPPSFASLRAAPDSGPVLLLNACDLGCDILILQGEEPIKHVPLEIRFKDLQELKKLVNTLFEVGDEFIDISQDTMTTSTIHAFLGRDMGRKHPNTSNRSTLQMVLECLWVKVARPVVDILGITETDTPKRIWWCPTGPFTALPIHAAGIYSDESEPIECLSQYAVSSYCASPQDLRHQPLHLAQDFKMISVIEAEAPNAPLLPATREELKKIEAHIPDRNHLLTRIGSKDAPTQIDHLLSDIQQSSIVHFGCHGTQNLKSPLESYLLLSGGKLTMSRLIKDCQVREGALAYLSACETAKGDEARPDESLNLVATMMFAGFRSVIGTLWPILDHDAPIVADEFYKHLFRKGKQSPPDVKDAAYGLHLATMELRRQGVPFHSWVPYVHYGI